MAAPPPVAPEAPAPALPPGIDEHTVFRSLFTAYPDALLVVDQSGVIVLANPSAAGLLGYGDGELVGLNVDVLVPSAIRPRHASYRAAYDKAPRPRPMGNQMDLVAKRKDGSEVMVEIALSPLQDRGLPLVVAAIRDISTYPRVRQALQRARYSEHLAHFGRLAADVRNTQVLLEHAVAIAAEALEVSTALVLLLEPNLAQFRVASGVGLVVGEEVGALIDSRDTSPGLLLSRGEAITIADYRTERRFTVPQSYLDAGLVSALAVPLYDRGRVIGSLAVRSRTEKRFGDEETRFLGSLSSLVSTSLQRAQTEEALGHAQRLESVGQLTGGIAHDFNNLLTIIQGNLQVLDETPAAEQDEYVRQLIAAATRASKRAAELTGKLLAFSRRQVLRPVTIDVGALLDSLADMLRRTLDQHVQIEVEAPAPGTSVVADPVQLESALLNIAINARDAMPNGGRLLFAASVCSMLPATVHHELDDPSAADGRFVQIRVTDNGAGMSAAVRERVFEPFFTTKEAGRGTGLGLSTVYGFVKQSAGAIAIDSEPGAGTTVSLFLPRPWDRELPAGHEGAAGDTLPAGLTVLLVEDDPEVRGVAANFLKALGCRVTVAANGEQALMALGPDAAYRLMLTDVALGPGMRGTALAAEAQRRFPALAILLMSGFSAELVDADAHAPHPWPLLRKPFGRAELARAMAALLG